MSERQRNMGDADRGRVGDEEKIGHRGEKRSDTQQNRLAVVG